MSDKTRLKENVCFYHAEIAEATAHQPPDGKLGTALCIQAELQWQQFANLEAPFLNERDGSPELLNVNPLILIVSTVNAVKHHEELKVLTEVYEEQTKFTFFHKIWTQPGPNEQSGYYSQRASKCCSIRHTVCGDK